MNISISKKNIENSDLKTLITFVYQPENKGSKPSSKAKSAKSSAKNQSSPKIVPGVKGDLKTFLTSDESISGKSGEMTAFRNANIAGYQNIVVVGMGDPTKCSLESARVASARITSHLKQGRITEAGLALDMLSKCGKADAVARVLGEGFTLSNYKYDDLKQKPETPAPETSIELVCASTAKNRSLEKALEEGKTLGGAVNFARWLGDSPGNKMNPTLLGKATQEAAKGTKLKVTVWDKATIKKNNMGALLGVAAGSDQDPRFIIMEYKGAAASKQPICFVGKGLTFDAGGISLKPGPGMEEMKYDMCGGANVIGAMVGIARMNLKVNAIAFVPASENMPGPSACKPGDVLTARNGKTIEVNNTDAEGRLILADALSYATEKKPAAIIDAATLTGAMMIALGSSHTGVYTNDDSLMKKVNAAAKKADESVWQMPLCEDHSKDMKGTYADLSNLGKSREAGSATAAAFLQNFVGEDIPWAHFDIAGTAWHNGKRKPYHPAKGASGIMVRTFVELAQNY